MMPFTVLQLLAAVLCATAISASRIEQHSFQTPLNHFNGAASTTFTFVCIAQRHSTSWPPM